MKASTREWIKKAESDYELAMLLTRRRKTPMRDHICFHCQQSAEKYLKARLEQAGVRFPKTHDIEALLHLAKQWHPLWVALLPAGKQLTDYGVKVRYPGAEATAAEVKAATLAARAIRAEVRLALGL